MARVSAAVLSKMPCSGCPVIEGVGDSEGVGLAVPVVEAVCVREGVPEGVPSALPVTLGVTERVPVALGLRVALGVRPPDAVPEPEGVAVAEGEAVAA